MTSPTIAALSGGTAAGGVFRASCTGGPACVTALALASREGIIVTLCLYVWAAAHYVLGAVGLERQLRAAADSNLSGATQVPSRARVSARAQVSSR